MSTATPSPIEDLSLHRIDLAFPRALDLDSTAREDFLHQVGLAAEQLEHAQDNFLIHRIVFRDQYTRFEASICSCLKVSL